jgi:hypothetical protein
MAVWQGVAGPQQWLHVKGEARLQEGPQYWELLCSRTPGLDDFSKGQGCGIGHGCGTGDHGLEAARVLETVAQEEAIGS